MRAKSMPLKLAEQFACGFVLTTSACFHGCWMRGVGCGVLDAGCRMMDARGRMFGGGGLVSATEDQKPKTKD